MALEKMLPAKGFEAIPEGFVRVSDIVSQFGSFGSIPVDVLENKKAIGTRVHDAIAEYIQIGSISEKLTNKDFGYFESFLEWFEAGEKLGISKDISFVETRLFDSKRMITGCVDGILCYQKKFFLVDWKTSANENRLTWPIQAALYLQLIRRCSLCDIEDEVSFIKLSKSGDFPKEVLFRLTEFHYRIADWAVDNFMRSK